MLALSSWCSMTGAASRRRCGHRLSTGDQGQHALHDLEGSRPLAPGSRVCRRPTRRYKARPADKLCVTEVEPLLTAALEGEAGAVIAYGMTGSGKV